MINGMFKYDKDKKECRIIIPLKPSTKKNSQQIKYRWDKKSGKRIPYISQSDLYLQYEKDCGWFLKPINIDYPINIKAYYYVNSRRKIDLNNLHSALHDILTNSNVIVDDNAKIVVSTDGSRVFYDKDNPRTEILITSVDPTFP